MSTDITGGAQNFESGLAGPFIIITVYVVGKDGRRGAAASALA